MKKAIVTGANGFIGSALVRKLLENRVEVIALDQKNCYNNIPSNARFIAHELNNSQEISSLVIDRDIDVFYHFAWSGSSGTARSDTVLQLQNVQWTIDCLKVAKEIGCAKFICAGSIMEHETISASYCQENRPNLGYIYGSGKLVAHTMCMSIAANIDINLIWAKITNAYGPGELSPRFVNTTIRKIINNEPLQFTSATQNYDFIYITDVSQAFYALGEKGLPFCHYVIGSSNPKPLREFILDMKSSIAENHKFIFGDIPFTGINLPLSDFDCNKMELDTGFKSQVSFADGVKLTMDWLKEQV